MVTLANSFSERCAFLQASRRGSRIDSNSIRLPRACTCIPRDNDGHRNKGWESVFCNRRKPNLRNRTAFLLPVAPTAPNEESRAGGKVLVSVLFVPARLFSPMHSQ